MKKSIFLLSAILISMQLCADSFYEQLCAFNFKWKNHAIGAPAGKAKTFASDKEYIQAHLGAVLPILKNASTQGLSKEQIKMRLHFIEVLSAYREAGKFPQNYFRAERIPVFIDENGTHCAVGYLMQQSGQEAMAQRISKNYQYAWLKDIQDENLSEWQQASGLSLEELKLIQGAYDSYMPRALFHPNKYGIPQKPEVIAMNFKKGKLKEGKEETDPANIWLKGEGKNGVLNGKWIQNFAAGKPWIEGYYENGKRTGLWKEYYRGTLQLCRTENWSNDKLNGIRKRWDENNVLIEEILFKDGKAALKTNYDLSTGLKYVRKPLDSVIVYTEIYTMDGLLLAAGKERIYNPGNLQWFQNIELTALNTFSVASSKGSSLNVGNSEPLALYNTPPLVEYKKEGSWSYYKEYNYELAQKQLSSMVQKMQQNFMHFGESLFYSTRAYDLITIKGSGFDSIRVDFADDQLLDFYGYGITDFTHLKIVYQPANKLQPYFDPYLYSGRRRIQRSKAVQTIGLYTKKGEKTGEWRHYNELGQLYKTENFIIPRKEEELVSEL
ncbi:MAG: hypothetical protein K0S33_3943 [Bacteroidetes bacterium]|jgi:antitoxin component YwqK of YwqJK toxin-antitoxin module|nr:hypothetical protein [Bacteroidota bacterium]